MNSPTTTEIGCQPTFIDIGPGRCATSWLWEALRSHPEIEMSPIKETEFFNTHFERGVEWYESHFKPGTVSGEVSTNYYLDSQVATRIRDYRSDMKIVINLRDPFSLLESFYGFGQRRGLELPRLPEALNWPMGQIMGSGYQQRERAGRLNESDRCHLLDAVKLADRLLPFLEAFPESQIHFFVFERLAVEPELVLQDLYSFLDVSYDWVPESVSEVINSAVQPKSRWLAKMATHTAGVLRSVGAYRVLAALHRSRVVKKLLFRSPGDSSDPRSQLPGEVVEELEFQKQKLLQIVPGLHNYWGSHE